MLVCGLFAHLGCDKGAEPASPAAAARPAASAPGVSGADAASSGATATADAAQQPPGANGSTSMDGAQCFGRNEIETDPARVKEAFMIGSDLSVVRVAPDDTLSVREKPAAEARRVHALGHGARGLRPSGNVCVRGETAWIEISADGRRGWVHGAFVKPSTPPKDASTRLRTAAPAPAASPAALAAAVASKLGGELEGEGKREVEVLGTSVQGARARAEVWLCCFADDSVMGEQISLEMQRSQAGEWSIASASARSICRRGLSGDLCL